jgi:hypothetical protein
VKIKIYKVTQEHVIVFVSLHSNKDTSHRVAADGAQRELAVKNEAQKSI